MKFLATVLTLFALSLAGAEAVTILGVGTASLVGGDLTDPENNGDPENNVNYNATFGASEEPNFGGAEGAFNVFDNQVGTGNAKFCCGDQNNFPVNPIWVQATFTQAYVLTRFTLTSANDTPGRDPVVWQIQGSNDGVGFTNIFSNAAGSQWTARDQVVRWDGGGVDFATPAGYTTFRFNVDATSLTTGARFQLAEIEFFGTVVPEPSAVGLLALAVAGLGLRRRRR